jgi:hypothetical protein
MPHIAPTGEPEKPQCFGPCACLLLTLRNAGYERVAIVEERGEVCGIQQSETGFAVMETWVLLMVETVTVLVRFGYRTCRCLLFVFQEFCECWDNDCRREYVSDSQEDLRGGFCVRSEWAG